MRGVKAKDLVALVDFIYLGEASIVQEQLERFLALTADLELKGLSGSSDKEAPAKRKSVTKVERSFKRNQQKKTVNKEKRVKEGKTSNVKFESNVDKVTVNPLDLKAKQTIRIDSDTMAKIDSYIERQSDQFACTKCDFTSTKKNHIREHVEKHIEDLTYLCNVCNRSFRSSNSLRNHDYRAHRRNC